MPRFYAPLDLSGTELRNARTQNLAIAPSAPEPGLRYYDTVLNSELYWNGTRWVSLTDSGGVTSVDGRTGAVILDDKYVDITGDTMTGPLVCAPVTETNSVTALSVQTATTSATPGMVIGVRVKTQADGGENGQCFGLLVDSPVGPPETGMIYRSVGLTISPQQQWNVEPGRGWGIWQRGADDLNAFEGLVQAYAGIRLGNEGTPSWTAGATSPEDVVVASIGSLYSRTDGNFESPTIYYKAAGNDDAVGWVGVGAGGGEITWPLQRIGGDAQVILMAGDVIGGTEPNAAFTMIGPGGVNIGRNGIPLNMTNEGTSSTFRIYGQVSVGAYDDARWLGGTNGTPALNSAMNDGFKQGDWAVDYGGSIWINTAVTGDTPSWVEIGGGGGGAVESVDGLTGVVVLDDKYVDVAGDTMTGSLQVGDLPAGTLIEPTGQVSIGTWGGGDAYLTVGDPSSSRMSADLVAAIRTRITNSGAGDVIGIDAKPSYRGNLTTYQTVTGVRGGAALDNSAFGRVANAIALAAASPERAGGFFTNAYGLDIESQAVAGVTNAYGIYQHGPDDINHFAGVIESPTGYRFGDDTTPSWTVGAGTPEGVVSAPVGSMFSRTDGGTDTSMYRKEVGTDATGWVALTSGGPPHDDAVDSVDGRTGAITLSDLYVDITGDNMTGNLGLGVPSPPARLSLPESTDPTDGILFGADLAIHKVAEGQLTINCHLGLAGNLAIGALAVPGFAVSLPNGTASDKGIRFGTDTFLFRSAANTLTTAGTFTAGGTVIAALSTTAGGFRQGAAGPLWISGAGTPESAVIAPVGSLYSRTDGGVGTALYRKESGVGTTGWVAVATGGGAPDDNSVTSAKIVDGTIVNIDIAANAAIALSKLATDPLARANHTGTQVAATISDFNTAVRLNRLDQMAVPTATVNFNGQSITGVASPSAATDAVNKTYVDNVAAGLDFKASVRAAATTAVSLAAPGATIDGVTLTAGNRILLTAQATASENGIYVWNGAAVPATRASDADVSAEVTSGLYVLAEQGTTNGSKAFVLATPDPITLGTTALAFTLFSGGGATSVGTANRITVTGPQIDIASNYTGQASITTLGTVTTGVWNGTPVPVSNGGTGATNATDARTNLGITNTGTLAAKFTTPIGNGSLTSFPITHSLNSMAVLVEVYETTGGATVLADVARTGVNSITVSGFAAVPTTNQYTVVVIG
jgi:hypothetical protein